MGAGIITSSADVDDPIQLPLNVSTLSTTLTGSVPFSSSYPITVIAPLVANPISISVEVLTYPQTVTQAHALSLVTVSANSLNALLGIPIGFNVTFSASTPAEVGGYEYFINFRDANGLTLQYSSQLNINVQPISATNIDVTPPIVKYVQLTNPTNFFSPGLVIADFKGDEIESGITAAGLTINGVTTAVNTGGLASRSTYSGLTLNLGIGVYNLTATVVSPGGLGTKSTVIVVKDSTPPVVTFTTPTALIIAGTLGGTTVPTTFTAVEDYSVISNLTLKVTGPGLPPGGTVVAVSPTTGLNSLSATGAGSLSLPSLGTYQVTATGSSAAGIGSAVLTLIIVDVTPPTVSFTAPSTTTFTNFGAGASVPLAFVANDRESPLNALTLFNGITPVTTTTSTGIATTNATAGATVSLTAGTYTFTAKGTSAGGTGTATLIVNVVDGTAPTVSFTSPTITLYTNKTGGVSAVVSFKATEDAGTITSVGLTQNGNTVSSLSVSGTGTSTATGTVTINFTTAGTNVFVATGTSAGGTGTASLTIKVVNPPAPPPPDSSAPVVVITSPSGSSLTVTNSGSTASVTLNFKGTEDISSITNLILIQNGNTVSGATTSGLGTLNATGTVTLALANGTYTFVAKGSSAGGVGTSSTVTVTVVPKDATPPTVCFTAPSCNSFDFVPGKGITVCVQASEDKSPITSISMTVNGTPVTMTPSGLGTMSVNDSVPLTISAPGTYTVVCTAVSAGGTGSATKTMTFTIDYNVCWSSPSYCNSNFKAGCSVPIAFYAKDDSCHAINDGTVQIVISENGHILQTSTVGTGTADVRYSCGNYATNFKSATGSHTYKVQAYFRGAVGSPLVQVDCSSFTVSGSDCNNGGDDDNHYYSNNDDDHHSSNNDDDDNDNNSWNWCSWR